MNPVSIDSRRRRSGRYELRVTAPGFKTFVQPIVVETSQTVRADAAMELGATQENVTVTGEAVALDRETSAVSTQVTSAMVSSLPYQLTNSLRNPFAFVKLTPGAVGTSGAGDGTQIAGSRTYGNEAYVDGVPVSCNPWQNVAGPTAPALETVAEFRVETALRPRSSVALEAAPGCGRCTAWGYRHVFSRNSIPALTLWVMLPLR